MTRLWYAALGLSAAGLSVVAGAMAAASVADASVRIPAAAAVALGVLHSIATAKAAPLMFRQRSLRDDPAALSALFDRFARWQAARATLQVTNLVALLWLFVGLSAMRA